MDRVPAPFAAALRRAGVAEVDDSRRRRAEYSSDASNYRVVPAAVVFPRSVDEVLATLDTCREHAVPLTARGAGTSIAGNAIGPGVVADLSRHLNQVLQVDRDARTAVVQPGAILDAITAAAAPHGLRFGPDPSTHARATIGGALGNNACGSRALRYGRSADNVVDVEFVTGSGRTHYRSPPWPGAIADRRPGQDRARPARSDQDRVRPVHPAGFRLLARAPAARERRRLWPSSWSARRARWA